MQRTEYRLTADGVLLDPATADPTEYSAATRRWIVQRLPIESAERRRVQTEALTECNFQVQDHIPLRLLADAVLDPHAVGPLPDDLIMFRVSLPRLSEGAHPVKAPMVHVVTQLNRAVTSSSDQKSLDRLVERVRILPPSRRRGTFVVVRALLSLALEDATAFADQITSRTAALEDSVFSDVDDDDVVSSIYRLKRAIADSRRRILPVINKLALTTEIDDAELGPDAVQHLERIENGLRRVADALETDDRLLGDMLTAQLTMVQVQQNTDMRKISAYAGLVTVPTLIAGIYGMNFTHMPELNWVLGYPLAIATMLLVVIALRWGFKRSGWL